MIDMTFIRTVESALACAIASALARSADEGRCAGCSPDLRKVCKEAAQRLYFELDGMALLDLGMNKLAAEQDGALRPAAPPNDAAAA